MFPAVDPARVTNTYQAVEPIAPGDESLSVNALFDLKPSGYFLYYGALEPKKNIGRLLEAFLASDVAAPLVLVGPKGWMAGGELRLLKTNLGLEALRSGRIRRLDYLPRAMLMQLVRGALAVVFPSIYEGFGLPALEAMMVGTPLLTSGSGALAEIVGKAALMVDPYDVGAIRTGLTSLERDADLRAQLAREGLSRAEEFSMAAYRERLSTLYAEVLARPRRPGPSLFSFPQGDEKP
jgi:glycosyltransferase involved in cell wall biosynthesis